MPDSKDSYQFPWGFHLGDLHKDNESIPLYMKTDSGGFCLLYDKTSEAKADTLLQCLSLELLETMPAESLKVSMFDYGRKKFYNLSPLKPMQMYENAYDKKLSERVFNELEKTIVSRYQDILCCNRQTINEHNQKSKLKKNYHFVLINLEVFPEADFSLRRINNFIESAQKAGVYIVTFANLDILKSESETTQAFLKNFKQLHVKENNFEITEDIFEFCELLEDHEFKSLDLDKDDLMQKVLINANVEAFMDPTNIKLETNTKTL